MFEHASSCYVALPEHVAGRALFNKVTVATSAPVATAQATVIRPFWQGVDLAIGVIQTGALSQRCIAKLSDLSPTARTRAAARGLLLRVNALGEEVRDSVDIINREFLTFTAQLQGSGKTITQGTSGAFVFVEGKPIGMALESDDPTRGVFMHADEIEWNINRFLTQQGGGFTQLDSETEPSQLTGCLDFQVVSTSIPPTLPQYGVENLFSEGEYVFPPNAPLDLVLRSASFEVQPVSRVILQSPSGTDSALPKDISVSFDASREGARFRFWTSGQMRPDGQFDTTKLGARNAQWLKVSIRNYWSSRPEARIQSLCVQ